jgi:acyl dehydratase
MSQPPTGLYFEDYELEMAMRTRGRTVTEADIVAFGSLTGDFNPMHMDAEYMKGHMLGQRVAHGMLTLSYAVGQAYQLGFMEQTVLAFRGLEMKFSQPVYIGDTCHVELKVSGLQPAERLGGGMVTLDVKIVNQKGSAVQKGTWTVLVASRPKEA